MSGTHEIYLEIGKKKTFAGALAWPGWCRMGRDEEGALEALLAAGPRYAALLGEGVPGFEAPEAVGAFAVVERLEGNVSTDFGAPALAPAGDEAAVGGAELARMEGVLQAAWRAFDGAVAAARGHALRKGPRGGGRELEAIVTHVAAADIAYLKRIGWKLPPAPDEDEGRRLEEIREGILAGLRAAVAGELPTEGPRGGKRWSPRYFVRRVAWHVIDHAWEIEDRVMRTE